MHELSLCTSVAEIVTRHAAGRHVVAVHLQVGQLRQVVPETLTFCWTIATRQTPLADATLDIDHIPAQIECRTCQAHHVLDTPLLRCPTCTGHDLHLVTGQELHVTSIEVDDTPTPPDPPAAQPKE